MSTAVGNWAQIPELVSETLSYFESTRSTLFVCAQVNRLWAELSTGLLWKHIESVQIFNCIGGSLDRYQLYAGKVRTIGFWAVRVSNDDAFIAPASLHPELSGRDFSRVLGARAINTQHQEEGEADSLLPYLNSPLRTLAAYRRIISSQLLRHLQINCTSLTHLRLGGKCACTVSEFLQIILELPLVDLICPSGLSWTSDNFINLGTSSTLQSLSCKGPFHESPSSAAEELPTSLFPALRRLKISGFNKPSFLQLFALIPLLRRLDLHVNDGLGPHFIRYLSGSGVRELFVEVHRRRILCRDDLITLAETCPHLESLYFKTLEFSEDPDVGVIIHEFVQRAANLRSLAFHVAIAFLSNDFINIDIFESFNHEPRRHFKSLAVPARLKASSIYRHRNDEPPVFPYLESLEASGIEMDMGISHSRIIRYLARVAPLLKNLEFLRGTDLGSEKFKTK